MRDMLDDELDGAIQLKLREYKQSYKWLFIVLCVDLGIGAFYFILNHLGRGNDWVFDYYRLFHTLFILIKLPLFIIAIVKVKPVAGRVVMSLTLLIALIYFVEDWWRYFYPETFTRF